ncbi:alcohol dehydrogenase catalytic domain-containing protein [Microbacterium sp. H37-C3]|uniref:zinc-dependent alcohol dehydrogenase n=1 Tax=Microbacterium sp. H37-C3 TaxID=3004354 RepID=UPI0022AFF79A|nr:alcohol dehydrogenase catalytic domain-containing protein [Microbacterium sp. H37-C3]MCZ4068999.1 alcohol dehydrogenase catalytic domain-containing protein [Microbacterium sp. H37-C3]
MRSAAYVGDGKMVAMTVEAQPPATGEVQVAVSHVGLCGTDLHILHGAMDSRVTLPAIIGHEMSGRVAAVGDGVSGWTIGAPVTVMPLDWCSQCPACDAGNQHICQNLDFIGIDSTGALQERWNVPARALVALPESLPLRDAALVEPVAVAVHDVRRSELTAGDRAVVVGGGPIGVLIATVARDVGAEIVLIEVDASRRAAAEALGFRTLDPLATDQVAAVQEWTSGAGADVVFEVSGAAAAVLGTTALAKVRGTIVVVAIHPDPRPIDLKQVFWRELRLLGARVYQRTDFERAVELLDGGVIPADALITDIAALEDIQDAFAKLGSGAMKVLVDVAAEGAPA